MPSNSISNSLTSTLNTVVPFVTVALIIPSILLPNTPLTLNVGIDKSIVIGNSSYVPVIAQV